MADDIAVPPPPEEGGGEEGDISEGRRFRVRERTKRLSQPVQASRANTGWIELIPRVHDI